MRITARITNYFFTMIMYFLAVSSIQAQNNPAKNAEIELSFNGTFLNTHQGPDCKKVSENGIYKAMYDIGLVTDESRQLINFELYKNETKLYSIPELPGADIYISNAGYLAVVNMDLHFNQQVSLHFYDPSGNPVFKKTFNYASLFNFSPSGKKFGVGTDKNFTVFSMVDNKSYNLPPCSKFCFSEDESLVAIAKESGLQIYKYDKRISTIHTGLFYPRSLAISQDNNTVWIAGKSKLKVYDIISQNLLNEDILQEDFSFRELKTTNGQVYAGVHYKKDGISKGILRTYDVTGNIQSEKVSAEKSYKTFEAANKYKPKHKSKAYDPIPWPFEPFNQVHKVWNHYEQHMGDGTGSWSYLHQGLDLEVPINEPVYAVEDGWVKLVLTLGGDSYWRVAVCPEQVPGYSDGWLYAHLVQSSIMVDVGDYVEVHDYIGDIIYWSADWGHIHFVNIHDQGNIWYYDDDEWGINFNPLLALDPITDAVAPVIENFAMNSKFGFCVNQTSNYLSPENLSGDVDIIAKISDFHGSSNWEQPAFKTYYWFTKLPANDTVFPKTLGQILNHTYPQYNGGFYESYAPLMYKKDNMHPSPPWMNTDRDYYQVLTNNNGDSIAELSEMSLAFETTNYTDGDYKLFVEAWDEFGNMAIDSQVVTFNNGIYTSLEKIENESPFTIFPNPVAEYINIALKPDYKTSSTLSIKITNSQMETVFQKTELNSDQVNSGINIYNLSTGLYFITFEMNGNVWVEKVVKR
ncbi:MAG: T9SS type A sorting domain-containing protein [Bacteroidales bacterium]|nr:T9SS type A sorting domain-containing protein [Bacteroidales bacterium]MCF8403868.1 T9SS type A sorting domain-containing protein [Bacteroidales bacterium]